jgi:hypothetical protein
MQLRAEFLNPIQWSTRPKCWVPGFDRVTPVNSDFFKKSKQRRLLKIKSQRVAIEFLTGSYWVAGSTH